MKTPDLVLRLVERFARNRDAYQRPQYNETQVRREFLDPFFKALGWDVDNVAGYAQQYKDVVHEDAIKIGLDARAPDYSFRIGGQRKFFVEAKKPAVNIKDDPAPAYQLRRYAWSAKLPLSILSDFQELAVYDCRVRPDKSDRASVARTIYIPFTEYEERWDEIAGVFSKEAILQGSFDRYVESTRAKRGTAEVDKAFLGEIESWREALARNIALRNPSLSQRELNYAVQATIDRIIFLRICEDRGIEPYGRLQGLLNGSDTYGRLKQLFYEADARYDSGLFHFADEKGRHGIADRLTPTLTIDDKALKEIIRRLYYPESPYEFSVLPADILGQVYEQFLGKVIRLTPAHRAVVEDKPEVKKAGGVYYTPTYIVDYIVKQTVGKLLEGKTPKQAGELRILDPACGSGSFLIGAYQYLLDWHRDRYVEQGPEKHRKELYQGRGGAWHLTTAEKKRILLSNIYGVDIDAQAVETTKLSLLLKVLEDETSESLDTQLSFLHERALPDLRENIKCGNSLIGPDFYDDAQLGLAGLDEEERYRINVFDWEAEFPQIMGEAVPEERRGFDAVIGNPPYVRVQRIPHAESDYYYSRYQTPSSKTDLSQVFIEKSLTLVNRGGLIGFICTSQWISTEYGREMRRLIAQNHLCEIVHFGSLPVFPRASTYPAIFVLGHNCGDTASLRVIQSRDQLSLSGIRDVVSRHLHIPPLSDEPWGLGGLDMRTVVRDRGLPWRPLRDIAPAQYGIVTGLDAPFLVTPEEAECEELEPALLYPYAYRGAEVIGYMECQPSLLVIYPYAESSDGHSVLLTESDLRSDYPKVHQHLSRWKQQLRARRESRKAYAAGDDWFRHARPGSFQQIRAPKLIAKGIATSGVVGVLRAGVAFSGANVPAMLPTDLRGLSLEYVLAVLNSRVMAHFLRTVCPPKLGGHIRVNTSSLNEAPIPVLDASSTTGAATHETIRALVAEIRAVKMMQNGAAIAAERDSALRRLTAIVARLDRIVYDLYGLTDDEIALVEESTPSAG